MTGPEFAGVDIDLLADYLGGALDGTPDEATVAALIAGDPAWRSAHDTLTGAMASVETSLRALGRESEPMPADLAVRLERSFSTPATDSGDTAVDSPTAGGAAPGSAALDSPTAGGAAVDFWPIGAELATPALPHLKPSRSRHLSAVPDTDPGTGSAASGTGSAVPASGSDVPREAPVTAARKRRRLRWAAPAAAAAGVVAFAGFGIDYLVSSGDASDSAASTAGGAPEEATPMLAPVPDGAVAAPPNDRITSSGTNYQELTLAGASVRSLASDSSRTAADTPEIAAQGAGSPLDRLRVRRALLDCLDAVARDNGAGSISVESVDYARYRDAPAVIVRFTAANGTWVQASGADCGAPGGDSARLDVVKVG